MINLTENKSYKFTIIKQIYRDNVDIFELSGTTFNSAGRIGIVYAEPDIENKIIKTTKDIVTDNPYYFIEYWRSDEHMAVLTNVTFIELNNTFALISVRENDEMETFLKIEKA